jgi:hypothetical protein
LDWNEPPEAEIMQFNHGCTRMNPDKTASGSGSFAAFADSPKGGVFWNHYYLPSGRWNSCLSVFIRGSQSHRSA